MVAEGAGIVGRSATASSASLASVREDIEEAVHEASRISPKQSCKDAGSVACFRGRRFHRVMAGFMSLGAEPAKSVARSEAGDPSSWGESLHRSEAEGRPLKAVPSHLDATRAIDRHRLVVYNICMSEIFNAGIGLMIVMNAITIGIDQTFRLQDKSTSGLDMLDNLFLCVYILELAMHLFARGWKSLLERSVQLDCVLVLLGILTNWILTPMLGSANGVGALRVLRSFKLLRLARIVRLLVKFRVLWTLLRGLLDSGSTMIYTMLLLAIIAYVLGSVAIELIRHHVYYEGPDPNPDFVKIVDAYWSSLPVSMLTLLQSFTQETISNVYKPLIELDFRSGSCIILFYAIVVILVLPIVLMNLITAVIVKGALEGVEQNKEAQRVQEGQMRKRTVRNLKAMFIRLDEDKSGEITMAEILKVADSDRQVLCELTNMEGLEELFCALDIDGSGCLTIDEFCHGIWQAAVSKVPIEIQRMERHINSLQRELKHFRGSSGGWLEDVQDSTHQLQGTLAPLAPPTQLQPPESAEAASAYRRDEEEAPPWALQVLAEIRGLREMLAEVPGAEAAHTAGPLYCASGGAAGPQ